MIQNWASGENILTWINLVKLFKDPINKIIVCEYLNLTRNSK